jgi:hypothetical protein
MPSTLPPEDTRLILRSLALPPPCRTLLVVSCGDDALCLRLAGHGLQVTGVDRDEKRVANARERAAEAGRTVSFQVANAERTSFADHHFDAVLCYALFEWVTEEAERRRLVEELCRVADRYVLLGYAAPLALGALAHRLRTLQAGRWGFGPRTYRTTRLPALRAMFARHGFRLLVNRPRQRFLHPRQLAVFQRI